MTTGRPSEKGEEVAAPEDPNLIPDSEFTEPLESVFGFVTPTEPQNPILSDPPRDNPGGVDGDRPPRSVPGLP
jgi:hypothetical protein